MVVADVNTIWRRKPFEALSAELTVIGLAPRDPISAWRAERWPLRRRFPEKIAPEFYYLPIMLVPGWASRHAASAQAMLWKSVERFSKRFNTDISHLVVTIPQFLPLLQRIAPTIRTIYYVSDDYQQYAGWSSEWIRDLERVIIQRVDHIVYNSRALAQRNIEIYPDAVDKIHVSMNATEKRFLAEVLDQLLPPPDPYSALPRPILGVVGEVSDSLDLDLLLACVDLPEVGTLLFVGPVSPTPFPGIHNLQPHPKCVFVGRQPHEQIPHWMQCLDVALIPYRSTSFNYLRSPMRLFDHLASGRPIVATDKCAQVTEFSDVIRIAADKEAFIQHIRAVLAGAATWANSRDQREQIAVAKRNTWHDRAAQLSELLSQ